MSLLDLVRAADEAGAAPALFDGHEVLDYRALLAATDEPPPPLVRAKPQRETIIAIHRALRHHQPYAPLPADATPALEQQRLATLRRLPLQASAAALIATSGSSGPPRIVELSRAAYSAHAQAANQHLQLRNDDRWLITLPLDHTGGLSIVLRCLAARAAVIIAAPPPLTQGFARWLSVELSSHLATRLSLVPAQLIALVDEGVAAPKQVRSVLLGGQALPRAIAQRARELGWPIVRSYGLTETCGMCAGTALADELGDDVGGALPGTRFRIDDGLLSIASSALATRVHGEQGIVDGWLRTADRASLTDGRLTVHGRADDLIVSGGRKIDPRPIEEALAAIEALSGSVVVEVPDARFGAIACALISPTQKTRGLPAAALRQLVEAKLATLARVERPRRIEIVEELPRLASGKIDRRAARALALQLASSALTT